MGKLNKNNIDFFDTQSKSIFSNPKTKFYHMSFIGKTDDDFVKYIIHEAEINSRSRVLDIGCGSGYFVDVLKDTCNAEGITNSEGNLEVCKKLYPKSKYTLGSMESFESKGKTHCIFLESLSYGDVNQSFRNCYKNLEVGGMLFMKEWCSVIKESKESKENIKALEDTFFYSPQPVSVLINLAEHNGFHLIEEKNLIHEINSDPYISTIDYHNEDVKNFRFPHPDVETVIPIQLKFRKR